MKPFCTLLLFIALPCLIFAQSNYHEGYVIKNNGDTLKGFIDYHEWDHNPRSIDFKTNKADHEVLNFNPQTIRAFGIDGLETYIAYKGTISMDKNRFPDLPLALDTSKKIDTIFIKQLTRGKYLALFYHQDEVKGRFFVAEANSQPVELKYYQYYDSESQATVKALYRGQLLFYINKYVPGNGKLAMNAGDAKFDQRDIGKIIAGINGETDLVKKTASFRFFIGGGLNSIKSRFWDNDESIGVYKTIGPVKEGDEYPETVSTFSTTVSPRIGLGVDLFPNPEVQKLAFRVELSFSDNSPKFHYLVADPNNYTNKTLTYSFDQYSATLTPQVILNLYNKTNFKIYVNAGFGLNFSTYNNEQISKGTAKDLQTFWANIPLQAGVVLNKRWELSLSYSGYAELLNYISGLAITSQYTSVGFRYLLGSH